MRLKKIKINKDFYKSLDYKVKFDWESYYEIQLFNVLNHAIDSSSKQNTEGQS